MSFYGIDEPEFAQEGEALPEGFFNMPDTFIADVSIQALYYRTYKLLLDENPGRDTIETMMIERAAALYAYMRSLEATEGYKNSSDYRQLTGLWNAMANDLRKTRAVNFDESEIKEKIAQEYIVLVNNALKGFDTEIAATIRKRVALALRTVD